MAAGNNLGGCDTAHSCAWNPPRGRVAEPSQNASVVLRPSLWSPACPGGATIDHWKYRQPIPARRSTGCRSEEHTSELQSLMRLSYAVFCLKQKTSIHELKTQ